MDLENDIFKRTRPIYKTLIPYGFTKDNNIYKYSKNIMNNAFRVDIEIDNIGIIKGKIYDLSFGEEYTNFRIESQTGKFVSEVREEYKSILKDIRNNCFDKKYFITDQANRITKRIIEKYENEPEFAWDRSPGFGIFRNPNNEKWYGLVMNIDKSKIDKKEKGEVEIINVKLDEEEIPKLLKKKGYYPAYHMNKKTWITILLDDSLSDEEIMNCISTSHKYTESSNEWIVPANPKYYDIISYFNEKDTIEWKQSNDIKVGDIVYLYVADPYSAILYKCEAIEVNIPYEYMDKNIAMNRVMRIKLLEKYDKDKYPFSKLNEYGIKAIRGPRSVPEKLSKELNKSN